jgi:transcription-repair coupling factor (superfamily II helicase)
MKLAQLLSLIEETPAYRRLIEDWPRPGGGSRVVVLDAAKPYLIAALQRRWQRPMLVVTAQPEGARKLQEQIAPWVDAAARLFPEPDALPYERLAADATAELERVQVLSALVSCGQNEAPLILASAPALMTKTASHADFASVCHTVEEGMEAEPLALLNRWEKMGYTRESVVEMPGAMGQRGGIVDCRSVSSFSATPWTASGSLTR